MLLPGLDGLAGRGEAAVDQVGPVLDLLRLAFDDVDQGRPGRRRSWPWPRLSSAQMPSKLWELSQIPEGTRAAAVKTRRHRGAGQDFAR
jgi:hypothetical protein